METSEDSVEDIFQADGRLREDILTGSALAALRESLNQARETCWDSVRSPHVFLGLLAVPDGAVREWVRRLEQNVTDILHQFQELFRQEDGEIDATLLLNREFLSDNVINLLRESKERAFYYKRVRLTPMDMLVTMLTTQNSIVAECFERSGITAAKLTELAVVAEFQAEPRSSKS